MDTKKQPRFLTNHSTGLCETPHRPVNSNVRHQNWNGGGIFSEWRLSGTFEKIKQLIASGNVRFSEHGYDELANDDLTAREIVEGVGSAILVEDYPEFSKGPTVLLLQSNKNQQAGTRGLGNTEGSSRSVVLVTAYRPDPTRWNDAFTERRR